MKAVFAALVGTFLVLAWTQPAFAFRTVTVQNSTNVTAHVDIIFRSALCSDDRFVLTAGRTWSKYSGVCLIKSFTAWIEDPSGNGHACRPNSVAGVDYRILVNRHPAKDGYCTVHTSF